MIHSQVTPGSDNIFADLGLPDAEDYLIKTKLALRIIEIIRERKLSQTKAAALLGIDQPKVSALVRGKLDGFSLERLFRFLNALGRDVEIIIRPKAQDARDAHLRVLSASE